MFFALLLLTTIERSADGRQFHLVFDAPVSFTQAAASQPARIIIEVPEAAAGSATAASAAADGVTLTRGLDPPGLRIAIPVPAGSAARAFATGAEITVLLDTEPVLMMAGPAAASRPALPGGIPAVPVAAGASTAGAASREDYLLGPEDLLEINVFELPELKTATRVLSDGTVSLPLVGVVKAAGLTKTGFESHLKQLLEERFLLDPQVTISVTEYRSRQVSVIGAVTTPGTYQMLGPRTVLQVISEAGGLTAEAGADIFIIRKTESGRAERLHLDLDDLVIKGNPELNLALTPGDVINVPVDRPVFVFVDGAVKTPGQIETKSSRPVTLLQAVARAGGLTERANLRGVHILRKGADGAQTRIPVNLRSIRKGKSDDIDLVDGDVVVVPETFF